MKFIIPTAEFNFLINKMQNIVPVKPAIPVLANFLVEVSNGVLTLTATDLTVAIQCQTEVKVLEEGSTAIPARRLASLTRELVAPNLHLTTHENHITDLVAGTSKFKLHGVRGLEFPKLPDISAWPSFQIEEKTLKDLLYRVSFAVGKDESHLVITGVLMRIANQELTVLATDGKRLSRAHAKVADAAISGSYIIPQKAVEELLKSLSETGIATVYLLEDKIGVKTGTTTFISKLIKGEFPDVSPLIPTKSDAVFSIHREELMTLIRQVALFTADNNHSVKFTFTEGELHIMANTREVGEGRVSMPLNYRGPNVDIAFNPGFFLDILRHSKSETLTMGINDSYSPGVISETEEALSTLYAANPLFVIMPMRLSES